MTSINFIGGEKGGVGKSVVARLLAQYFIDHNRPFTGFDTDRSHNSFTRFYSDYASPVVVDSFDGLDQVVAIFDNDAQSDQRPSVVVDLAAQTASPLGRWIRESELLQVLAEIDVAVNFWHVVDGGKDSATLLGTLTECYGAGPNYIVVRNRGRGSDFSQLDESPELASALALGAHIIDLPELQSASMQKIDRQDASFWAAVNMRSGPDALGMLERQRVKFWMKTSYTALDQLPL